jgi:hypothetical protein
MAPTTFLIENPKRQGPLWRQVTLAVSARELDAISTSGSASLGVYPSTLFARHSGARDQSIKTHGSPTVLDGRTSFHPISSALHFLHLLIHKKQAKGTKLCLSLPRGHTYILTLRSYACYSSFKHHQTSRLASLHTEQSIMSFQQQQQDAAGDLIQRVIQARSPMESIIDDVTPGATTPPELGSSSSRGSVCSLESPISPPLDVTVADSFVFTFDIDGVLVRGGKAIPEAIEAMKVLNGENEFGVQM